MEPRHAKKLEKLEVKAATSLMTKLKENDEERRWNKMLIKQTHALPVAKKRGFRVGVEEKFYGFVGDKLLRLLKHSVWWIFCMISKWLNLPAKRR